MLSNTELKIMYQISQGLDSIKKIAQAIMKSEKQTHRMSKKLKDEDYIIVKKGKIRPNKTPHVSLLLQVLREQSNIIDLLSRSGIPIFISLLYPKNIQEIIIDTGLKKSIIYKKIRLAQKVGLVYKKDKYILNKKLWPNAIELFEELQRWNNTIDTRVQAGSVIFFKNKKEIVFSNVSEIDATKTAFSVYDKYGITLLVPRIYYYLPIKKLSKREILLHSIYIAEKTGIQEKIFVSLFYVKFRQQIKLRHPTLDKIDFILKGNYVEGYPKFNEIKERCNVYDIKI